MKRLLIIIAVILVLVSTNPSRPQYLAFMNNKVAAQIEPGNGSGLVAMYADKMLDMATTSQNYIIGTVYETNQARTVGVLNNFFSLNK